MKAIAKIFVVALLLGAAAATTFAGPIGGPRYDTARCLAYSSRVYDIAFRGNELATVTITGDGDTDLDLYVYDMNNVCVARGIGLTDHETVTFVPPANGLYRIEVRNLGNVWNQYTINMR